MKLNEMLKYSTKMITQSESYKLYSLRSKTILILNQNNPTRHLVITSFKVTDKFIHLFQVHETVQDEGVVFDIDQDIPVFVLSAGEPLRQIYADQLKPGDNITNLGEVNKIILDKNIVVVHVSAHSESLSFEPRTKITVNWLRNEPQYEEQYMR